jgi:transcription antitermination protein NusB
MSDSRPNRKHRQRARRLAMQAMYQWQFTQFSSADLIQNMLQEQGSMKFDQMYFEGLVTGVVEAIVMVDEALTPHLDRPLSRLNPVELAVLRIATYEMLHQLEIPFKVIINEAVELSKNYGSVQGYQYVNAVLDKLAGQHRSSEIKR